MKNNINVKVKKNADEMFRVLSEELISLRASREFEIEMENGDCITINKWVLDGEREGMESDWTIIDGQEIHDKMSEEQQNLFFDFVSDLEVIK